MYFIILNQEERCIS